MCKLNEEFSSHAKRLTFSIVELKKGLLDRQDELRADPLPRMHHHDIAQAIGIACSIGICTPDEVANSCVMGGRRTNRSLNDNLVFAVDNSKSVVQFLLGRTNKAMRVAKSADRYNPPAHDIIQDGFMGWRRFVAN